MNEQEYTQFFRCTACSRWFEMTERLKKNLTKCKCGAGKFSPTILSFWEATHYLVTHPAVALASLKEKLS